MKQPTNYRDRVTFTRNDPGRSADTDGHLPESAEERFTTWAEVRPLRGRERFLAQQTQADTSYVVLVRYCGQTKAVDPSWWLTLENDGKRLNITEIRNVDRQNRWIEIACNERTV